MRVAISKEPAATLARCELTFLDRQPIDVERARAQHLAYRAALEQLGCRVTTLPPDDRYPDSCFVEDTAVVLDELIILTRPGVESRLGEVDLIAPFLGVLRPLAPIGPPATLDGGDVVRLGRVLYVGFGGRTNRAGIHALQHIAEPLGYEIVPVPFHGCLHLKTGCTALDEDTLLINPAWVDPDRLEPHRALPVADGEPWAADVLRLGGTVLMNAASPRTIAAVEARGCRVLPLDLSEFMKAEAGVTCLSLVIEGVRVGGVRA